ncbi:UDP-N-acetylmuramoyl-tripeptide--D-alanyl-D-alanine ligase [Avibacterium sp. 21-586]|uniref:UDP-N-acetylmuramoyl-tripeptide--D-alanyl-D- alanine ligase n=1 Tax=Avibacterium sp. 21-586 TaxID=2911534 RepID=UPI0022451476|nr:UDP-N-acetylmuramoyl-tripeptide--D-alanyl-D-alanine ligase [Avibacterium sp. 21-586]MCW9710837.1 UDP-N-acetylmuramoyl-tripeptide--D-alanyl-D-alanine ligase [Avibacterium sp. 21-586]
MKQLVLDVCNEVKNNRIYDASNPLSQVIILSVSDGMVRAKVKTLWLDISALSADGLADKVQANISLLQNKFEHPIKYIRLEWVLNANLTVWDKFNNNLSRYKRNYFRAGIAFEGKREPWLLLTEMELNANACLYSGAEVTSACVNQDNLVRYIKARHGSSQMPDFVSDEKVIVFQTAGFFIDVENAQYYSLDTQPRYQGHRKVTNFELPQVEQLIQLSTHYLSEQVKENGMYEYGYFPCFDRIIPTYNTLRHASSTYAMLEGYQSYYQQALSRDQNIDEKCFADVKVQIDKALDYLITQSIRDYADKAYVIDMGNEIKLGANAVAILALVKYLTVFPTTSRKQQYLALCEKLACGILAMQKANGGFVHVLNAEDLSVKEENRIIYYDGEAAFGLMRLYGIDKDPRWLDCVVQAFDYFIENKHEKAHDHWLSYCSNELVKYLPEKKYFAFAVRNIDGYVSFINNRITTFPTLLELSVAFHKMLLKLDEFPEYKDEVLADFDVSLFYQALHNRAKYLINGFFYPEVAMFFKNPQRILHGFFIRHHAFRVRIDDVEHYLSGLVGYREILLSGKYPTSQVKGSSTEIPNLLNKVTLPRITNGRWIVEPKESWFASGICAWPKSFKPHHLLVERGKGMTQGYLPRVSINSLLRREAAGVITDDENAIYTTDVPVLLVKDIRRAVLDIGLASRNAFKGKVIGVTGSAGKTSTVFMLSHTLNQIGKVEQTLSSANLPIGIAWNMASMNQRDDFWVLEMAIGNMSLNSQLVQPDVAIITNIAPAHLEYHHTVENIALKKARIFESMKKGQLAVICRDIPQFDLIAPLAEAKGLKVLTYGEHSQADVKLITYSKRVSEIVFPDGATVQVKLAVSGKHFVLNAMAILAIAHYFQFDMKKILAGLSSFSPVSGRNEQFKTQFHGFNIEVIDDAYNANPLSMCAALDNFAEIAQPIKNKVLIIGDMLELGKDSDHYHHQLGERLKTIEVRHIILVGSIVGRVVAPILSQVKQSVSIFDNVKQLKIALPDLIKEHDLILLKGSNSIGLSGLFIREA